MAQQPGTHERARPHRVVAAVIHHEIMTGDREVANGLRTALHACQREPLGALDIHLEEVDAGNPLLRHEVVEGEGAYAMPRPT